MTIAAKTFAENGTTARKRRDTKLTAPVYLVDPIVKGIETDDWTIVELLLEELKREFDESVKLGDVIIIDDMTTLELCGQKGSKNLFTGVSGVNITIKSKL
jgi:hypothetical protein